MLRKLITLPLHASAARRWQLAVVLAPVVAVACAWIPATAAQEASAPLIVGTKQAPPFAIRNSDGTWSGISIELWERMAAELGVRYELRETTLEGLIRGLEEGELDLSVAALTVTSPREARVDFSHPFYASGLGIATVGKQSRRPGWALLSGFFSLSFLKTVAALALLLLISGLLIWLLERRRNPEQFGGPRARGLGAGFWWAAVTMTTVGYGDKAPVTFWGRIVGLVWMFASIIVISTFTGLIASSFTLASLDTLVQGPEDLPQVRVAAPVDSVATAYLKGQRISSRGTATLEEALDLLAANQVDAVVYDEPMLRYLTHRQDGLIQVLPGTFEEGSYAIALPSESPLREPLNRALLRVLARDEWRELLADYLGE